MTHWVNYLPEVGRPIIKRGQAQVEICKRIKELENEIVALEQQHKKEKEKLLADVLEHWTREEIAAAENYSLRNLK